jgi:CheY-like chemotaxis protein
VADRRALRDEILHFGPDVILADYHLDEGDTGIAALRWACAAISRNTPAVIVSADDSRGVRDAARAAGYRVLPKPVNPTRLTALIWPGGRWAQPLSAPAEVSPAPRGASP